MRWADRARAGLRAARAGLGATLAMFLIALLPTVSFAADPSPTSAAAGDPRSSGQGPGLVGDPLGAIGIVVLIAIVSLVATVAWVRATAGARTDRDSDDRTGSSAGLNR